MLLCEGAEATSARRKGLISMGGSGARIQGGHGSRREYSCPKTEARPTSTRPRPTRALPWHATAVDGLAAGKAFDGMSSGS